MTEQKKVTGLASRKLAVEVLLKVEQNEAFANQALAAAFKQHSLTERDRAFVTFIVQGTLRHQIEIDDELAKFSKKPIAKLHPPLRAVLRSAIFQITQMEDMPPSAVINAAVEIARKTGHEGQSKFVNGVLRSFLRSQDPATRSRQDASGCQPGPIVSKANGVGGAERAPGPLQDSASRSDSAKAADSATGSVSAKHGSNATDPKLDSGRLRTAGGSPAHVPNQE
ncbi:MAG: hypothetical protein K2Z81_19065, partial [Cyanobacteria bacterium]|nr:hypothetical protein [Cyanobacteriota bacterium]